MKWNNLWHGEFVSLFPYHFTAKDSESKAYAGFAYVRLTELKNKVTGQIVKRKIEMPKSNYNELLKKQNDDEDMCDSYDLNSSYHFLDLTEVKTQTLVINEDEFVLTRSHSYTSSCE